MSHTVTVTRTTTTSSTSAIILNTGYMKTLPGLLKLLETVIAGVCLFLITFFDHYYIRRIPYEFFLSIMTLALVASFCLLLSCLISLSTSSIISKTSYELVYHLVAFALTLAASVTLLVEVEDYRGNQKQMSAAILGIVLAILYLMSTVFAFRSYRGW